MHLLINKYIIMEAGLTVDKEEKDICKKIELLDIQIKKLTNEKELLNKN